MWVGIEYRPIHPKEWSTKWIRFEMLGELRKLGRELKKDLEATTTTWTHKPKFSAPRVHLRRAAYEASVEITTDDENWIRVDEGAPPHIILPRRARALAFQTGYRAKTRPRMLRSFPGGKFGPRIVRQFVMHPGHKPREFSETARAKYQKQIGPRIDAAIERGLRKGMKQ